MRNFKLNTTLGEDEMKAILADFSFDEFDLGFRILLKVGRNDPLTEEEKLFAAELVRLNLLQHN